MSKTINLIDISARTETMLAFSSLDTNYLLSYTIFNVLGNILCLYSCVYFLLYTLTSSQASGKDLTSGTLKLNVLGSLPSVFLYGATGYPTAPLITNHC